MKAILSGGKFHGREIDIEKALTNIVVSKNKAEGFMPADAEIPSEIYELVSIHNDTALYRTSPNNEISLASILDAAGHLPLKQKVSKCVCGADAMRKVRQDPQISIMATTPESLAGVFFVLDLNLPSNVAEMRDKYDKLIQKFILSE